MAIPSEITGTNSALFIAVEDSKEYALELGCTFTDSEQNRQQIAL